MATHKALVITAPKTASLQTRPLPTLEPDHILVKTVAVALNPVDWKNIDSGRSGVGTLTGCDYAGIVEEVGRAVRKSFKKGDRICGFAHGENLTHPERGSFAEYIVVKGDLQMQIPADLTFEDAATLGVGIFTTGQGLYQSLNLALPTEPIQEAIPLLIYGGSTATGTLAIQCAKLSGYTVLTTCSPRNFDLVKSRGADHVFDYQDPNAAAEIRNVTGDLLKYAFDTVSSETSTQFCDQALSTTGGEYSSLNPVQVQRENVNSKITMAYTVFGEEFQIGPMTIPAIEGHKAFAEKFLGMVEGLFANGQIKPHPKNIGDDGLKGILDGLQRMRDDKVSGQKLVYRVADTP